MMRCRRGSATTARVTRNGRNPPAIAAAEGSAGPATRRRKPIISLSLLPFAHPIVAAIAWQGNRRRCVHGRDALCGTKARSVEENGAMRRHWMRGRALEPAAAAEARQNPSLAGRREFMLGVPLALAARPIGPAYADAPTQD